MINIDVTALDKAANGIMEAAVIPKRWPSALEDVRRATGLIGVNILPIRGRAPGIPATSGMEDVLAEYFQEEWHLNDYRMKGVPKLLKTGSMVEQDFVDEDTFQKSSYYKFLRKHDFGLSAIVGFNSGDDLLCFVLHRGPRAGVFSREEEAILLKMQDRLTLSASIMFNVSISKSVGMAEGFDTADLASVFYNPHGHVMKLNQAAERLIEVSKYRMERSELGSDPTPLHLSRGSKTPLPVVFLLRTEQGVRCFWLAPINNP